MICLFLSFFAFADTNKFVTARHSTVLVITKTTVNPGAVAKTQYFLFIFNETLYRTAAAVVAITNNFFVPVWTPHFIDSQLQGQARSGLALPIWHHCPPQNKMYFFFF